MFTLTKYYMVLPLTVRIINTSTGEILFTEVINNFTTNIFAHKEKMYRFCDCLCRGAEKLDDTLKLEFYTNKYPSQKDLF